MNFLRSLFGGSGKIKTELFTPPTPPSAESVAYAEKALNIKFPPSFISFTREAHAMKLPVCARFYWIGQENLGADNIIAANHRERLVSSSPLPHFLVAFYNDGMGNQVCFDTRSRSADEEYPVVFWDHELGTDENIDASRRASASRESAGVIASSFSDWLKSEVERFA